MKHKFFIKGSVRHKYNDKFDTLEGNTIIELLEDEVQTKFINISFINDILNQFGLYEYNSYDVRNNFIVKLDIVNKL